MKSNATRFLVICSMAGMTFGCMGADELETESISETKAALSVEGSDPAAESAVATEAEASATTTAPSPKKPGPARAGTAAVTFPAPQYSQTVNCGSTFFVQDAVPAGGTLTYYTTDATSTRDPVMAMIQRYSPWNSTQGPYLVSPYTQQVGFTTLSQDDDYGGAYDSRVSYHNSDTSQAYNVWVIGFLYPYRTGYGNLNVCRQVNDGTPTCSAQYFGSNSMLAAGSQGMAWTTSTVDPILFGIDQLHNNSQPPASNGKWNDDCESTPPGGNLRDSCLLNFTSNTMWLVPWCPYGSTGAVTINL